MHCRIVIRNDAADPGRTRWWCVPCVIVSMALALCTGDVVAQGSRPTPTTGRDVFVAACQSCHGADGRGASQSQVGFSDALPDFTDCSYASRENAQDWFAVVHAGGPVRRFSRRMPAFGSALSTEQIERAVAYVRSLCTDKAWPRGELNLPRPIETEKAFPEDELVITSNVISRSGQRSAGMTVILEKRFGARNQYEIVLPVAARQLQPSTPAGGISPRHWTGAHLGDVAVALKRALLHSGAHGAILSGGAEFIFPTGDRASGFGEGTMIYEPFLLAAKTLGGSSFLQMQGGVEFPGKRDLVERNGYARAALGSTIQFGFGRTFTPIAEFVATRDLTTGALASYAWTPQLQVSLSRRQHVQANLGMRLPITDARTRPREFVAYFLWDWFDGPLLGAW